MSEYYGWLDLSGNNDVQRLSNDVQRLSNEVLELRRSLDQERSVRQQETAQLSQELKETKKQLNLITTYMVNQGQIFAAFANIEAQKE